MNRLKNYASITNLSRRPVRIGGQIATYLILIMVVILIFTLMTANMGQVSVNATMTANAADAAGLNLGSQLATKSHQLYISLGNRTKKCMTRSLVPFVLGVLLGGAALASKAILGAFGGGSMILGVQAGVLGAAVVGGAIGGAIAGTGVIKGAMTGVIAGFTIGGAANVAKSAGNKAFTAHGGFENIKAATAAADAAEMSAAINLGALATVASVYNESVYQSQEFSNFASFAKALNGLPDYLRIQQGVMFDGLSRVVDDPALVQDNGKPAKGVTNPDPDKPADWAVIPDLDGDGDTTEKIPKLLAWWEEQMTELRKDPKLLALRKLVLDFLRGPAKQFREHIDDLYMKRGLLSRLEFEKADGDLVRLTRYLVNANPDIRGKSENTKTYGVETDPSHPLKFYQQGPGDYHHPGSGVAIVDAWDKNDLCSDDPDNDTPCGPPPKGWSEEDVVIDVLEGVNAELEELTAKENEDAAVNNYAAWIGLIWDPDSDDDLGIIVNGDGQDFAGMKKWRKQLQTTKESLDPCLCESTANAPAPTLKFWAEANKIPVGGTTMLYWEATNAANGCMASESGKDQRFVGPRPAIGKEQSANAPEGTYYYTLTCTGDGGSVSKTITLKVGSPSTTPPPPPPPPPVRVPCRSPSDKPRNTPCKIGSKASVRYGVMPPQDPDKDDFEKVDAQLAGSIKQIEDFREEAEKLANNLPKNITGPNPRTYGWDDSRGHHDVKLEVGPFKIPYIKRTKKRKHFGLTTRICLVLTNGSDNGKDTFVEITRKDPANQAMKFWTWNPFNGQTRKTCRVQFDHQFVGMPEKGGTAHHR